MFAIVMTLLVLELIPREPVPQGAAGVRAWLVANWTYATRGRRPVDPALPDGVVRWFFRRLAVGPALYALGIALAFVSPRAGVAVYGFAVLYYVAVQNVLGSPRGGGPP
ncbi:hypothetical protein tb265_05850 [Gemmatimonadetes bacterium T265]|nr:hypothetical protein tb265_05850 [Gemmatimonadetes bacterium T265]